MVVKQREPVKRNTQHAGMVREKHLPHPGMFFSFVSRDVYYNPLESRVCLADARDNHGANNELLELLDLVKGLEPPEMCYIA